MKELELLLKEVNDIQGTVFISNQGIVVNQLTPEFLKTRTELLENLYLKMKLCVEAALRTEISEKAANELNRINAQQHQVNSMLESTNQQYASTINNLQGIIYTQGIEADKAISSLQNQNQFLLSQNQASNAQHQQEIIHLQNVISGIQTQLTNTLSELNISNKQSSDLNKKYQKLKKENKALISDIERIIHTNKLEHQSVKANFENIINSLNQQMFGLQQENHGLATQISELNQLLLSAIDLKDKIKADCDIYIGQIKNECEASINSVKIEAQNHINSLESDFNKRFESVNGELSKCTQAYMVSQEELQKCRNQHTKKSPPRKKSPPKRKQSPSRSFGPELYTLPSPKEIEGIMSSHGVYNVVAKFEQYFKDCGCYPVKDKSSFNKLFRFISINCHPDKLRSMKLSDKEIEKRIGIFQMFGMLKDKLNNAQNFGKPRKPRRSRSYRKKQRSKSIKKHRKPRNRKSRSYRKKRRSTKKD